MNINALLSQRAKAMSSQINLEDFAAFPELDPNLTPEQAVEVTDELEVQLESSLSKLDIVFESADVALSAEAIHTQQINDDLVEDEVTTNTLNAALDAVSNDVVEAPTSSELVPSAVDIAEAPSLEDDGAPAAAADANKAEPSPTNAEAKKSTEDKPANSFKDRLKKWKQAIVDFIVKIKDWFINLITNYEKVGEQLKTKSAELVAHFTSGKEFKFKVKTASVTGAKTVGSTNDITGTVKTIADELEKLSKKTNLVNDVNFAKEEVSFDVFGGSAALAAGDFKLNKSAVEKKEVELTMTASTAAQLKTSCDKLAAILATSTSAKKTMADAARAAETELNKSADSGSEENKARIKSIRNTVVFINNVYKLAGQQAKILLSEILPVRTEKKG